MHPGEILQSLIFSQLSRVSKTHITLTDLSANKALHFNLKTSDVTPFWASSLPSGLYWVVFHCRLIHCSTFSHWAPGPALERGPCVHPGDWHALHLLRPATVWTVLSAPAETSISLSAASPSLLSFGPVREEVQFGPCGPIYTHDLENHFAWVDFWTMIS